MTIECKPENARFWFAWRRPVNILFAFIVGLLFCLVSRQFWPPIIDLLLTAGIVGFLFYSLDRRGFRFACPHCRSYIETTTPWKCGYRGCENYNVDDHPFIGRCERCEAKPKAYKCHHPRCGELIYFTKDQQDFNYAKCINFSTEIEDAPEDEIDKKQRDIELKELKIKETQLNVTLKELRKSLKTPRMKTIEESYRAAVKNKDDEQRLRAAIDERFADDNAERTRRHLILDKIMRDLL